MAKRRSKEQNHAAYLRRKARAQAKGYTSPRAEYRARKAVGLRRGMPSLRANELPDYAANALAGDDTRQLRREAAEWSRGHSKQGSSRYRANMTNAEVRDYHAAYVERTQRGRGAAKRRAIWRYLSAWKGETRPWTNEWESDPQFQTA